MKRRKRTRIAALFLCLIVCVTMVAGDFSVISAAEKISREVEGESGTSKKETSASNDKTVKKPEKEKETKSDSKADAQESESQGKTASESQAETKAQEKVSETTMTEGNAKAKAGTIPFSVEDIMNAGVINIKFAAAIHESISAQTDQFIDGKTADSYTDVVTMLNEFNGEIDASNRGIESIEGVNKLRSTMKLDLSNNLIADARPLAPPSSPGTPEPQLKYYGTFGRNLVIDFKNNPYVLYPEDIGGRTRLLTSITEEGAIRLNNEELNFITKGTASDTYGGRVQIIKKELDPDNNGFLNLRVDQEPDINPLEGFDESGAKLTPESALGGKVKGFDIENIVSTGGFELYMEAKEAGFTAHNITSGDTVSGGGAKQTPAWIQPVLVNIYTKAEKEESTTRTVELTIQGMDDNQPKAGAKYSLYKKTGSNVDPTTDQLIRTDLTTGADGKINITSITEAGNYYFVQTEAPTGYDINTTPLEFTIAAEGKLSIAGGSGNSLTPSGGSAVEIDGTYLLTGSTTNPVTLSSDNIPAGVSFDSITVTWTEGNKGGTAGTMKFVVGSGTDNSSTTYVKTEEAALQKAKDQIAKSRNEYQNVTLSASFSQNIQLEQKLPLKPVDVIIKASKKLIHSDGTAAAEVPEFNFTLENADGNTTSLNSQASNNPQGEISFPAFKLGNDVTKFPKVYDYTLKETAGTAPQYEYDSTVWDVRVTVDKDTDGALFATTTYKKLQDTDYKSEPAEFTNKLLTVPLEFIKVDESNRPLGNAGFTLYKCTNTDPNHRHQNGGCSFEGNLHKGEQMSAAGTGKVLFEDLTVGNSFIIAETSIPTDCKTPAEGSYIVADIAQDGEITLTGVGDFAKPDMLKKNGTGQYEVKNIHLYDITVSKVVAGDLGDRTKDFKFTMTLKDAANNPITGKYNCQGTADGTLTFDGAGTATFYLKHGQSITLQDIPAGSKYVVSEDPDSNYNTSYDNEKSEDLNQDVTVTVTNTRPDVPPTGIAGLNGSGIVMIVFAVLAIIGIGFFLKRRKYF